jgi:hypothetical protein
MTIVGIPTNYRAYTRRSSKTHIRSIGQQL